MPVPHVLSAQPETECDKEVRAIRNCLEHWAWRQEVLLEQTLDRIVKASQSSGDWPCVAKPPPIGPSAWVVPPATSPGRSGAAAPEVAAAAEGSRAIPREFDIYAQCVLDANVGRNLKKEPDKTAVHAPKGGCLVDTNPQHFVKKSNSVEKMMDFVMQPSEDDGCCLWSFKHCFRPIALTVAYTSKPFKVREDDHLRLFVLNVVQNRYFNLFCTVLILVNAITIAISTNLAVLEAQGQQTNMDVLEWFEFAFAIFYTVELGLRVFAYRCFFFTSPEDWSWNWLDLILVGLAVYDSFAFLTREGDGSPANANLSFIRLVRIMKVVKTFRAVRVLRMFYELRLMVNSIFGCLKSLFWGIIMIVLITYIFGCCFTQACVLYLYESPQPGEVHSAMLEFWSSIPRSMDTLYKATTSGDGWRYFANPLYEAGSFFYFLFLGYVAFFLFVVVNTLTSIIIEATIANSEKERQDLIQEAMKKKNAYIGKFRQLYRSMDDDDSGSVDEHELARHLQDPQLLAFFDALEIDASDVTQFFSTLSQNGELCVDIDTFVTGCMKMRGSAKSMDLLALNHAHRTLVKQLATWNAVYMQEMGKTRLFQESVRDVLQYLEKGVSGLARELAEKPAVRRAPLQRPPVPLGPVTLELSSVSGNGEPHGQTRPATEWTSSTPSSLMMNGTQGVAAPTRPEDDVVSPTPSPPFSML